LIKKEKQPEEWTAETIFKVELQEQSNENVNRPSEELQQRKLSTPLTKVIEKLH
jgi:hypothetical protein